MCPLHIISTFFHSHLFASHPIVHTKWMRNHSHCLWSTWLPCVRKPLNIYYVHTPSHVSAVSMPLILMHATSWVVQTQRRHRRMPQALADTVNPIQQGVCVRHATIHQKAAGECGKKLSPVARVKPSYCWYLFACIHPNRSQCRESFHPVTIRLVPLLWNG